jgi:hypothetical protein
MNLLKANAPYADNAMCNAPAACNGKIKSGMMCAGIATVASTAAKATAAAASYGEHPTDPCWWESCRGGRDVPESQNTGLHTCQRLQRVDRADCLGRTKTKRSSTLDRRACS